MPRASLLSRPAPLLSLLPPHRCRPSTPTSFHPLPRAPPPGFSSHRRLSASASAPLCSPGIPAAIAEPVACSTEERQEQEVDSGFVEVGYIISAHGIRGELRVKPSTGFPELRFSEPGRRWLRTRVSGKELISEVELIEGRGHPGQKSWIISLSGIDTVDKAKEIVGSTLLVREGDKPELEEGEFYTADLVGMRVVLKETGRYVGKVVNVINTGASDLLQVMLDSTIERLDSGASSKSETSASGQLVWIPFVEAIVPDIDMDTREMQITPPKGLLELNIRSDMRSKKERRLMEWKERKKLQQRLLSAKKKLCEIGQKHLLVGFSLGEKAQKSSLSDQIVNINFRLFKHALKSVNMPSSRYNFSEFINDNSAVLLKNLLRVSHRCFTSCAFERKNEQNYELQKEGYQLLMKSKAAIVIIINDENSQVCDSGTGGVPIEIPDSTALRLQELFLICKRFLKVEEQEISIPVILVSPAHDIQSYEELLSDKGCFNFDSQKVQLLEGEKLPIVSTFVDENSEKILLKSPWEILQAPIGSGGVFSLLSTHKILDELNKQGVEYVQICSLSERSAIGHPLFFGFMKSQGADLGVKIFEDSKGDDEFDLIFSMRYLNRICKQSDKIHFYAVPEQHAHVELVEKEWIQINPDTPNAFRFDSSIYSVLNTCSLDKMCIMQISE